MYDRPVASLGDIAKTVRRVRFSETGFGDEDVKVVWHQGANGFDLISRVDAKGHVVDHELLLNGNVIQWNAKGVIRTGRLRAGHDDEHLGIPKSALIDPDGDPRREAIEEGAKLAAMIKDDRYLQHLAEVLRGALAGQAKPQKPTVTGMKRTKAVTDAIEARKKDAGLKGLVKKLIGK